MTIAAQRRMPTFNLRPALVFICLALGALIVDARHASAQPGSFCADCHFARPDAPGQAHLMEWDRSPHRRNSIGCERCHGGDPTTVERFLAHRDILPPSDAKSPVHPRNSGDLRQLPRRA